MFFTAKATTALVSLLVIALALGVAYLSSGSAEAGDGKLPVTFAGGHGTDPADGGRPVALIAAALGVPAEVFREAFRGVTPAKDGKPSQEQAQRNKAALMKVLRPHGVTGDRLDEVSDYYRYRPQKGE